MLLTLDKASHVAEYADGRKTADLRRRATGHRGPILLAGTRDVRRRDGGGGGGGGLVLRGSLTGCRGPFTAEEMIGDPAKRGAVLLTDAEIRGYLAGARGGYLWEIGGVGRAERVRVEGWAGFQGLCGQRVASGRRQGQLRWTLRHPPRPRRRVPPAAAALPPPPAS